MEILSQTRLNQTSPYYTFSLSPNPAPTPERVPFTTPFPTRKRKAADAANNETTTTTDISVRASAGAGVATASAPVAVAVAVDSRKNAASRRSPSSTSSSGKVRKLNKHQQEQDTEDTGIVVVEDSDLSSALKRKEASVDLATPATTSMESDDDFMSDASSPDFLDTQGSDVESLDGASLFAPSFFFWPLSVEVS